MWLVLKRQIKSKKQKTKGSLRTRQTRSGAMGSMKELGSMSYNESYTPVLVYRTMIPFLFNKEAQVGL